MEPAQLTSGHGWGWIKQGYALFMKAPLLWIVLIVIAFVSAIAISAVPVVGEPLVSLLMPAVLVGLMSGARDLQRGEELEIAHLFSGFQKHTSQLVTLGGIALVAQFAIFGVMMIVGGSAIVGILMSHEPVADPAMMAQAIAGAGIAMLLGMALFSILMMAMQYAPMLVYFRGMAPVAALKLSLRAFIANLGAMMVYGLTFFALALLASLPMMLGWIVLLPLMFTSIYISYCEIFPEIIEVAVAKDDTFTASGDHSNF